MILAPPGIAPPLTYIMVLEDGELVGTSDAQPTSGWRYLNESANAERVGCPSIRYSQSDRFFYVLGGGTGVHIQRSRGLSHWEVGTTTVMTCGGAKAPEDRRTVSHDGIFEWHLRDDPAVRNFTAFVPAGKWDKFASDLDVTEWENRTLVAYICGDQRISGMAMLAEYDGSLDQWLALHFASSSVKLALKSDDASSSARLVPLPAASTSGTATLPLAGTFHIRQTGPSHAVLAAAIARIQGIVFAHGGQSGTAGLHELEVNVTESFDLPRLGGNESYTLHIDASSATLSAPSINGALHGLQSMFTRNVPSYV